ncbi:MAG TPA: nicotinate (nicotinamide) nucleotide adenylyltransferase [Terracidiphilus sp.]|nr:nicotinate (nicotinamide) nucleotide adenylyltransferase [Terracidiphilus sp.]
MNQAADNSTRENVERPVNSSARIAFFGGSFDPPHLGHLAIARAARDAFHLDSVLFAPVGAQPLKPEGSGARFEDRLAMTRLAIEGEPGFAISLADAPKSAGAERGAAPEPNYTLNTLHSLRTAFPPETALYCLMGADSFFGLRHWHRAAEIPFAASLIVASRPGQLLDGLKEALPPGLTLEPSTVAGREESGIMVRSYTLLGPAGKRAPFFVLPDLDVAISASAIRDAINSASQSGSTVAEASLRTMLPAAVADYIRSHGLYR